MLDLAAAIDNSFIHAQAAPSFLAAEVAHSEGDGEAEFVRNMEQKVRQHVQELDAWKAEGSSRLQILEHHLEMTDVGLDEGQVARFLRLSSAIADRAERSALSYAHMVKRLKKQGRAFAKFSPSASEFVSSLALRIEASLGAELEFLMDISDHYRGLARLYGPTSGDSEVFEDPASAIAFLKSA
jgi:hypothetical protein